MHFLHSLPALPWFAEEEWCTYACTYAHVGAVCVRGSVEACTPTSTKSVRCRAQPRVCKTLPASPQHSLGPSPPAQLPDSLISRGLQTAAVTSPYHCHTSPVPGRPIHYLPEMH